MKFLPDSLPGLNPMMVFGMLLLLGVLGGLLAARARYLPSITGFMLLGLCVGPSGLGLLSAETLDRSRVLVDIALGLILFRLGVGLHPILALRDRPLVVTALAESGLTFAAIFVFLFLIGSPPVVAVLAAAIAVSSSPAVLIHVSEELKAHGPTVQRAKNLVAANNVLSFFFFSAALPFALMGSQVDWRTALLLPTYQMVGAVLVAIGVAWLVTQVSRLTRATESKFHFALVVGGVMLTLGISSALQVSTLFAGLAFGIACRWLQGQAELSNVEFGGGGDLFFVTLFVFAGANLHLGDLWTAGLAAFTFVAARMVAKVGAVYLCGRVFGFAHRPALGASLMLAPMAGLAIGLTQTTAQLLPELGARVGAITLASVVVFETIGPPIVAWALRYCGESGQRPDS